MAMRKIQAPRETPEEIAEKLLPQNVEAEAAVLGSLLIDPDATRLAADLVQPGDFYRESHRAIYQAMLDLREHDAPSDLVTLTDELGRRGQLENIGGLSFVTSLANHVPTSANVEHYARIVERTARLRELIHASGQIAAAAYNEPEALVALDLAERQIAAVRARHKTPSAKIEAQDAADLLELDIAPPRWAVPELFAEGLTIYAGKAKEGKSTLSLGVLMSVVSGGIALGKIRCERGEALYLALEDNERRMQRRLQTLLGYGERKLPRGLSIRYDWPKLDEGGLDKLDAWMKQHPKTRLIVIDTYKKIKPKADPRNRNATLYDADYEALLPLQSWAIRAGVAVVVIHHTRKSSAENVLDEISGSVGLAAVADNLVIMRKNGELTELHRRGRDYIDETIWALRGDVATLLWTIDGPWQSASRSADRQAIIDALRTVGLPGVGSATLASMLRREPARIRTTLSKMEDAGDLELGHDRTSKLYFYRSPLSSPIERETVVTRETVETRETRETFSESEIVVSVVSEEGTPAETTAEPENKGDNVTLFPLFPVFPTRTRARAHAKADGISCPKRGNNEPHEFERRNRRALVRLCKYCDAVEPNKALGGYMPEGS